MLEELYIWQEVENYKYISKQICKKCMLYDIQLDHQGSSIWSQCTGLNVLSNSQFSTKPTSIQGNEVHSKKETASPDKDTKREACLRIPRQ